MTPRPLCVSGWMENVNRKQVTSDKRGGGKVSTFTSTCWTVNFKDTLTDALAQSTAAEICSFIVFQYVSYLCSSDVYICVCTCVKCVNDKANKDLLNTKRNGGVMCPTQSPPPHSRTPHCPLSTFDTEKNIMQQLVSHWIPVIHCPILNCQAVKLHQVCQNSFQDYGGDMKN